MICRHCGKQTDEFQAAYCQSCQLPLGAGVYAPPDQYLFDPDSGLYYRSKTATNALNQAVTKVSWFNDSTGQYHIVDYPLPTTIIPDEVTSPLETTVTDGKPIETEPAMVAQTANAVKKNPYQIGFFSLAAVLVVVIGVFVWLQFFGNKELQTVPANTPTQSAVQKEEPQEEIKTGKTVLAPYLYRGMTLDEEFNNYPENLEMFLTPYSEREASISIRGLQKVEEDPAYLKTDESIGYCWYLYLEDYYVVCMITPEGNPTVAELTTKDAFCYMVDVRQNDKAALAYYASMRQVGADFIIDLRLPSDSAVDFTKEDTEYTFAFFKYLFDLEQSIGFGCNFIPEMLTELGESPLPQEEVYQPDEAPVEPYLPEEEAPAEPRTYVNRYSTYGDAYGSDYCPTLILDGVGEFTLTINTGYGMATMMGTYYQDSYGVSLYVSSCDSFGFTGDNASYIYLEIVDDSLVLVDPQLGLVFEGSEFH